MWNTIITTLFLTVLALKATAQDKTLSLIDAELSAQAQKVEANMKEALDEKAQLEQSQNQIAQRIQEIETARANAISALEVPVTTELLEQVLLKEQNLGACKIKKGKNPNEYYINKNNIHISFYFAGENSGKRPVARYYLENNVKHIELKQEAFMLENSSSTTPFSATLRFEVESQKVKHAVFTGERIYDGVMGFGSSLKVTILTCVL